MQYPAEVIANLKAWRKGEDFPPVFIEIKPTNNCNLDCLSCHAMGHPVFKPEEEVAPKHYISFIESAEKVGVKKIHIAGGGEPMTYPGIGQILGTIMEKKIAGSITTNGTLLTDAIIESMVRGGWEHLFISLDGADAKTHDGLRGRKGAFESVVSNIEKINTLKRSLGKEKPTIELAMVLSEMNAGSLREYFQLGKRLSARTITLQPLRVKHKDLGQMLELSAYSKKKLMQDIGPLREFAVASGINHNLDYFDNLFIEHTSDIKKVISAYSEKMTKEASIPCFHPWFFLSVQPDGAVYPCSTKTGDPFGNISKDTLIGIWRSARFESLRTDIYNKKLPDFCNMCCGTNIMITRDVQKELEKCG